MNVHELSLGKLIDLKYDVIEARDTAATMLEDVWLQRQGAELNDHELSESSFYSGCRDAFDMVLELINHEIER
jgi:hypothetical protein